MNRYLPLLIALLMILLVVLGYTLEWGEQAGAWIDGGVDSFNELWMARFGPESMLSHPFVVIGLVGACFASLICGVISSLVVSNRMAFFSDALAHCAFAGVSLGLILFLLGMITSDSGILTVTIIFGILVGALIAYVREATHLASDTVIGVFFAGAMGLGAVLLNAVSGKVSGAYSPEDFLFGSTLSITGRDLIYLALLTVLTLGFLCWLYNRMVFASFSPSLARSRNFPVRLGSYLFIILLALVVNLCLKVVGALLINALLVIPGATAAILARNLRQYFWLSVALSLIAGLAGQMIALTWTPMINGQSYPLAPGGVIVLLGVALFFLAMLISRLVRGPRPAARTSF